MLNYRLFSFNWKGRAELIRLLFAVAEVPFEDIRLDRRAWDQLAPCMININH